MPSYYGTATMPSSSSPSWGQRPHPWGRILKVASVGAVVIMACYLMGFLAAVTLSQRRTLSPNEVTLSSPHQHHSSPSYSGLQQERRKGMYVVFSNEYTKDAAADTATAYGWEVVAEPYRVTTMTATHNGDRGATTYEWTVNGHLHGYGNPIDIMFTTVGENTVEVKATTSTSNKKMRKGRRASSSNSNSTKAVKVSVMVRYVRREIRSLTDFDREAFFQAVMIMQRVPLSVGRRLYGPRYRDKDYFNRKHLYFGGQQDCDHWHKGPGFVTSHMAMTWEFERSLQAINPRVAVPYWDFTLESTFYTAAEWRQSPVFSPDWFGDSAPDNDEHTPDKGRFAYVPVMTNATAYSQLTNPYGLLRAPWNTDPTPFMTRSDQVYGYRNNLKPSGCLEYRRSAQANDWMVLSQRLNSLAHGHIHELMGGSWFHDYADENHREQTESILTFAHSIQAMSKEIWRAGFMTCPQSCSMDTPAIDCQCRCKPEVTDDDAHPYDVLVESGVIDHLFYYNTSSSSYLTEFRDPSTGQVYQTLPGLTLDESMDVYRSIVRTLCNPGHIGDMFQATSTNDITFWVLHPLQERLWHMVRLSEDLHPSSFFHAWKNAAQTCYGHRSTDIQPFTDLWDDDDGGDGEGGGGAGAGSGGGKGNSSSSNRRRRRRRGFYTNKDLYTHLHPRSPKLFYVYDNHEWSHCRLLGRPVEPAV